MQSLSFQSKKLNGTQSEWGYASLRIEAYGVVLRSIEKRDLSRVRTWRNQARVRTMMRHQEPISAASQQRWYAHIRQQKALYFIMETPNRESYGLIHLSCINFQTNCAQAGLFVGNARYNGSLLVWMASYSLLRFAFDRLRLSRIEAQVLADNLRAQRYNESFGFRRIHKPSVSSGCLRYYLSAAAFSVATRATRAMLHRHAAPMRLKVQFGVEKNKKTRIPSPFPVP